MHGWNLVMHGRLHNFDDDEKGIVDKLAMSTQSCILDQKQLSGYECQIVDTGSQLFFKLAENYQNCIFHNRLTLNIQSFFSYDDEKGQIGTFVTMSSFDHPFPK